MNGSNCVRHNRPMKQVNGIGLSAQLLKGLRAQSLRGEKETVSLLQQADGFRHEVAALQPDRVDGADPYRVP